MSRVCLLEEDGKGLGYVCRHIRMEYQIQRKLKLNSEANNNCYGKFCL